MTFHVNETQRDMRKMSVYDELAVEHVETDDFKRLSSYFTFLNINCPCLCSPSFLHSDKKVVVKNFEHVFFHTLNYRFYMMEHMMTFSFDPRT